MATKIEIDDKVLQDIIKNVANPDVPVWTIHDGVEYGVHQEFSENGHPSLVPAYELVTKDLPKGIGEAVEKGVPLDDVLQVAARSIQRLWADDVNVDTGAYKNSITAEPR